MIEIPRKYPPMLLRSTKLLPQGDDWLYELKFDGYRMEAELSADGVALTSRNNKDFSRRYPSVVEELPLAVNGLEVILDGEMVGFNDDGQADYMVLRRAKPPVNLFVFDILQFAGQPTIDFPIEKRRSILEATLEPTEHIKISEQYDDRDAILSAAIELDQEGVVAKRKGSRYKPGNRSWDWYKLPIKHYPNGFVR